jgi:hypothetical protein
MAQNIIALGGFGFERQGDQLVLRSPQGTAETDLQGFLRGAKHLLKMKFDLEGSAELNGGLVFRAEGKRVQLKLGQYSEFFPSDKVEALFRLMMADWISEV